MHPTAPASHLGKLVDSRYRLQRVVGEGASAWVFAATDQRLEREVALKLFKPPCSEDDLRRRKRCIAEGRTLAKLVHPHIVAIHDASEDESGQAYLTMELCEAGTLETELAQRGRLELAETLRLVLPLMGALALAHDRNVVHLDIKPGNIVLVEEQGERRCKLLDFGISLGAGVRTASGLALGTPSYMAPEQARGEPATPATDVWALGVVLFRCLAGVLPFEASSSAGVLLKVVQGRAPRLSSLWNEPLGNNVVRALDRALEPDLARRYPDLRSFARALACACALDGLPVQRPEPIGLPQFDAWFAAAKASPTTKELAIAGADGGGQRGGNKRRLARWLAAATTAALLGAGTWSLSRASEQPRPSVARRAQRTSTPASSASDAYAPSPGRRQPSPGSTTPAPTKPSDLLQPAAKPTEQKAPSLMSSKRRKSRELAEQKVEPLAQQPAPRVIMNWDW